MAQDIVSVFISQFHVERRMQNPMPKLRFSGNEFRWKLGVGYWVFKTLKFLYVNLTGFAGTFMERHQLGGMMFGEGSGKEEECRQVAGDPKIQFPIRSRYQR